MAPVANRLTELTGGYHIAAGKLVTVASPVAPNMGPKARGEGARREGGGDLRPMGVSSGGRTLLRRISTMTEPGKATGQGQHGIVLDFFDTRQRRFTRAL